MGNMNWWNVLVSVWDTSVVKMVLAGAIYPGEALKKEIEDTKINHITVDFMWNSNKTI